MRRAVLAAITLALAVPLPAAAEEAPGWTATLVATDLEVPVDLVFGPDGTLYYAELETGNIRALPAGESAPIAEPVAHVDSTRSENGGLLGLALDPDFDRTGAIFVYYSFEKAGAKNGQVNRVSRLDADGERVLLDDIPWFERHDGGRLVFTGPDTLVVATGDNELRDPAQDPASPLGKMLRMTREGKPAPDNPDPTSLVYSIGHRNPFGLAYDAASGTLWSTENGPQRGDEINIIRAGKNYGWPAVVGIARHPSYVDPVFAYEKTIGPTGGTVLEGEFYFGAVNDGTVRRISVDASGKHVETIIRDDVSPVLDVEAGPDGRLYVASWKAIHALSPPGNAPPSSPPTPPVTSTPAASPPATTPAAPPTLTASGTPPAESTDPTPEDAAKIPAAGAFVAVVAMALALASGQGRRR